VLDDALRKHLRDGVTVVVATVGPAMVPVASKGYGAVLVDDRTLHVFLAAGDIGFTRYVQPSSPLAVTSGNVYTFKSVQFKGVVESVEPSTPDEQDVVVTLMRVLNERIAQLQNIELELVDRRLPQAFLTCAMRVTETFDQSPGPDAGRPLDTAPR
jgi:hypothetical protein